MKFSLYLTGLVAGMLMVFSGGVVGEVALIFAGFSSMTMALLYVMLTLP